MNIEDSRRMQKLTESAAHDSAGIYPFHFFFFNISHSHLGIFLPAAMKQIAYLTMLFLPASFVAVRTPSASYLVLFLNFLYFTGRVRDERQRNQPRRANDVGTISSGVDPLDGDDDMDHGGRSIQVSCRSDQFPKAQQSITGHWKRV